uniref:Insulin receptor substrate 1 n=1 Tax=Gopherus agassizii TaxID=38772 RepID=A0A452H340_9SAUR
FWPGGCGPRGTGASGRESPSLEFSTAAGGDPPMPDVRLCGHLRKQKSQRRRFFVLRAPSERGPARLEYYDSEKKFGAGGARPKRSFALASALHINKRADARHRHLIVLYGRDGTFGLAAESAEQQEAWYRAMMELRAAGEGAAELLGSGAASPFREVWHVSLRPKGLGQARNLVGVYRLCLAESTVELVQLSAPAPCLVLQLLSVRRCGHSENYFFLEVGRSAATGPGELWMQVEDLVVARHIHETILEAMKRLSEECRVRGRGQASAPISVPARRLPPAQPSDRGGRVCWGFAWGRGRGLHGRLSNTAPSTLALSIVGDSGKGGSKREAEEGVNCRPPSPPGTGQQCRLEGLIRRSQDQSEHFPCQHENSRLESWGR